MTAYTRNELVPVSEVAKNLNKILNTVKNSKRKKMLLYGYLSDSKGAGTDAGK